MRPKMIAAMPRSSNSHQFFTNACSSSGRGKAPAV
jgi:hypothetical protein